MLTEYQKTRTDLLGLSTEEKPTADNEYVVDGTTFYEVDTGDLYIFYKGEWYNQNEEE